MQFNNDELYSVIQPGDVVLMEGRSEMSRLIKLFTSSHWSHAAIYVGDALIPPKHRDYNIRICRPYGILESDLGQVVEQVIDKLGMHYDNQNFQR